MTYLELGEPDMQSDAAERLLIAAAGRRADAIAGVLADLPGGDFYDPARGHVWEACRALSAAHEVVEPTRIARWLVTQELWRDDASSGPRRVLSHEMLDVPQMHLVAAAAVEIAGLARRREMLRALKAAHAIVVGKDADPAHLFTDAMAAFREAAPVADVDDKNSGSLGWEALIDEFEAAHAPGGSRPGIPSPWIPLDNILGGLFGGRVYVFGGRPGHGKSTAALAIAQHAAIESLRPTLVISKEMPSVDVTGRLLSSGAEVPLADINAHRISDWHMQRIRAYVKEVGVPPITVNAKPRSLSGIKMLARTHHQRYGLDVLVVDYLQLVRTDAASRTREQEVAEVSRQLKELSLELDCAVVLPAQLNRESTKRADGRPTLSDLRDSGQIEQDADAVILLHRPVVENSLAQEIVFIVEKNRHGPTAEVTLQWRGGYGRIS